ncbi:Citrate transporter [Methylocella silvestris BL2]|uniref:Citrate transporter n=1 Tax=Methylocella silvestris (strain DSM 15510 / CIP 108128 / LMG 27833 / NCIMB 13906 / BL2) TaxID=395965 RepID=B8ENL3_METSB|nr:GntP family permease [Methylocella silvestris]ACK50799.1 Citrate transporter [Methylocella silvestris BL2]
MNFLIALAALVFLMVVAYRGFSVILFAPIAAMLAVLATDPSTVPTIFTSLFMEKMVGFLKLYFPAFLLGAIFGKVIELSGFSQSIVSAVIGVVGHARAILSIVLVCAILTYGGVSLFVVVFAAYPFAAEMFRQSAIPKRLIPGTIALGAFSFTMDALPGTPQIQNIIPTTFFQTTTWAAPILGLIGSAFILGSGLAWLEWRRRQAAAAGEGYGQNHIHEPEAAEKGALTHPLIALSPLLVVFLGNRALTSLIGAFYGPENHVQLAGMSAPVTANVASLTAIWAVQGALIAGILTVFAFAFRRVSVKFAEGSKAAVAGALLAGMNTASEYGFGAVIAALPGFITIRDVLAQIGDPLVKVAVSVSTLAGVTGSASGGLSIALAAMSKQFIAAAEAAHIPMEVLHRVAAMASGGMDTLPHNGAVITVLAVTGLTHKTSYIDIFAVTILKTAAVFVVIGFYYLTGLY